MSPVAPAQHTDMPSIGVRFARTAGPFAEPAAADWADLSANPARSLSTRAGRPSPLERVPPTELTLVLDNANGNLDPRNTAGAYFPDVVPGRHLEVMLQPGIETNVIRDAFNRLDSTTTLGSTDTGVAWEALVGTWGINANQAYNPSATASALAVLSTSSADGRVSVDLASVTSAGLAFRLIDASNYLYVEATATALALRKMDAGLVTTLASAAVPGAGTVKVEYIGASVVVQRNGTTVLTHTLSAANNTKYAPGRKRGLWANADAGARFDNFSGDAAPAPTVWRTYVERWQPQWSKGQAVVVVTAKDAKALFAGVSLWPSVAEKHVLGQAPRHYFPMTHVETIIPGATTTTSPDVVTTKNMLLHQGTRTVDEPFLPFDHRGAINFAGPDSGQYGVVSSLVADNNGEWTVEFLLHALDKAPDFVRILDGGGWYVHLWNNSVGGNFRKASDGTLVATPTTVLQANRTHLIMLTFNAAKEGRLYVNNSYIGGVAVGGNIQGPSVGTGYYVATAGSNPVYGKAWIGRLTAWDKPRYLAEHQATWAFLASPWGGDSNMFDRFATLLTELGWPVARLAGVGSVSRAVERMAPNGDTLQGYMEHLEDSEGGYIYVTPAGVVTFVLNTAPTTFADVLGTGAGELPYADGVQVVDGVADIVTEVEAIRRADGTPIVLKDSAAAAKHGTISKRLEGLVNVDRAGATGEAQTFLERYKVERPRVENLVLYPRRADTGWSVPLAAHTGKGYRFKYAPETGSAHDWNTSALTVDHDADWQADTWTTTLSLLWEANAV